ALADAPAGTIIEFLSANTSSDLDDDEDEDAIGETDEPSDGVLQSGNQRYVGTLTGAGTYQVSAAFPAMSAADLLAAMEVCRRIDDPRSGFEMPSEADARAVVALARGTAWFGKEKDLPKVKGTSVFPASKDEPMTTGLMVFRQRFAAGPWDTGTGQ